MNHIFFYLICTKTIKQTYLPTNPKSLLKIKWRD